MTDETEAAPAPQQTAPAKVAIVTEPYGALKWVDQSAADAQIAAGTARLAGAQDIAIGG